MKVLRIDGTFLLPADFGGDALEALAELVRFLGDRKEGLAVAPHTMCFGDGRGSFSHNVSLGLRFSAVKFSVHELVDGKPWRRLVDLKPPPNAHVDGATMMMVK